MVTRAPEIPPEFITNWAQARGLNVRRIALMQTFAHMSGPREIFTRGTGAYLAHTAFIIETDQGLFVARAGATNEVQAAHFSEVLGANVRGRGQPFNLGHLVPGIYPLDAGNAERFEGGNFLATRPPPRTIADLRYNPDNVRINVIAENEDARRLYRSILHVGQLLATNPLTYAPTAQGGINSHSFVFASMRHADNLENSRITRARDRGQRWRDQLDLFTTRAGRFIPRRHYDEATGTGLRGFHTEHFSGQITPDRLTSTARLRAVRGEIHPPSGRPVGHRRRRYTRGDQPPDEPHIPDFRHQIRLGSLQQPFPSG